MRSIPSTACGCAPTRSYLGRVPRTGPSGPSTCRISPFLLWRSLSGLRFLRRKVEDDFPFTVRRQPVCSPALARLKEIKFVLCVAEGLSHYFRWPDAGTDIGPSHVIVSELCRAALPQSVCEHSDSLRMSRWALLLD